jgi:hypothetical protein
MVNVSLKQKIVIPQLKMKLKKLNMQAVEFKGVTIIVLLLKF